MSFKNGGRLRAKEGKVEALHQLLAQASTVCEALPGCQSYRVHVEGDVVVVDETWDSDADHKASLQNPQVLALIGQGRELIAGFD